jgi:hypothetical protein
MLKFSKIVVAGSVILLLSAAPSLSQNTFRFLVWGDATDLVMSNNSRLAPRRAGSS